MEGLAQMEVSSTLTSGSGQAMKPLKERRRWHSMMALMLAGALALAMSACGSDEDVGGGEAKADRDTTAALPADAFSPKTADEKAIVAVYAQYANAMAAADASQACDTFSATAEKRISRGRSCVEALKEIFALGRQSQNKPYVAALAVRGKQAQGRVKLKLAKEDFPVTFAKEASGEWKIDGSGEDESARNDTG
jgi:hypothetical protein